MSLVKSDGSDSADAGQPCPLDPLSDFAKCLGERGKSVDDLVSLIPANALGRSVCDTLTFLSSPSFRN